MGIGVQGGRQTWGNHGPSGAAINGDRAMFLYGADCQTPLKPPGTTCQGKSYQLNSVAFPYRNMAQSPFISAPLGPLAIAVLAQKVRKVVLRPRFLKVQLKGVNYATQTGIFTFGRLHTCTGKSAHTRVAQTLQKVSSDRLFHS